MPQTTFKIEFLIPIRPAEVITARNDRSRLAASGLRDLLSKHPPAPANTIVATEWSTAIYDDQSTSIALSRLFPHWPTGFYNAVSMVSLQTTWVADLAAMSTDPPVDESADSAEFRHNLAVTVAEELATARVQLAGLASVIAMPGYFQLLPMAIVNEAREFRLADESGVDLPDINRAVSRTGWPTLVELDIDKTFAWLVGVDGVVDRQGIGPIGRALAALSYLISPDRHTYMDLAWALLGLEALYARSGADILGQILTKSEVLLGPRLAHTKTFKAVYNLRSRLLHGDADIPFVYAEHPAPATSVANFTMRRLSQRLYLWPPCSA